MNLRALTYLDDLNPEAMPVQHSYPSRLEAEVDSLKAQLERMRAYITDLERAADTDPLLPIYNRRAFMRELVRAQYMYDRLEIASCVVFLDLNNFKAINDRYGHAMGDKMLREVGNVLLNGVRGEDTVARLGGDEFGVLLLKTDPDVAKSKAEALSRKISEISVDMPTESVTVTAAWGVASCNTGNDAEAILSRADQNMYAAKRRGQCVH